MFNDVWLRLRSLFRRKAVDSEMDEELRFHFEKHVEKLVRSGVAPAEARRRSRDGGLPPARDRSAGPIKAPRRAAPGSTRPWTPCADRC